MKATEGWKEEEALLMAVRGWKVVRKLELPIKLIENWVWARCRLAEVSPLAPNNTLKAETEASVVRLRLEVW